MPAASAPCVKCCAAPAQALVRVRERLCAPCLHGQLQAKFRAAVRLGGVLRPGDHVVAAFSGGPCSAMLLRLLEGMRGEAGARPERSKTPFRLTILHVDEGAAAGLDAHAAAAAAAAVEAAVAPYLASPAVQFLHVNLEDAFAEVDNAGGEDNEGSDIDRGRTTTPWRCGDEERRQRRAALAALLAAIPDTTGREDLLEHLRSRLLLATAARIGAGKVARGDSATRLATRAVAAAAKGRGYALAGDVHLVDARRSPAAPLFFFPLRELGSRELALAAHFERLLLTPSAHELAAAAAAGGGSGGGGLRRARQEQRSINALAERFVAGLQAHNPGTVANILGTAAKLRPFAWNNPPELACTLGDKARRNRQQHLPGTRRAASTADSAAAAASEAEVEPHSVLCPLCSAPLAQDELPAVALQACGGSGSELHPAAEAVAGGVAALLPFCLSCRSQILGDQPSSSPAAAAAGTGGQEVADLLPPSVRQEARRLAAAAGCSAEAAGPGRPLPPEQLRQQIAEFLID